MTLAGFALAFDNAPGIELVAALNHRQALEWSNEWQTVDVVVVDAADETRAGDQFPGVAVVTRIRQWQGTANPSVIVVTGHFLNDGLRHRMAGAQADFFFLRAELRTTTMLQELILKPQQYRRGVPPLANPDVPLSLGLSRRSHGEEVVNYVEHHGLEESLDPAKERSEPRSRRWLRHRRGMAEVGGIEPINLTTGLTPYGNQRYPSFRQLRCVYQWLAKVSPSERPGVADD